MATLDNRANFAISTLASGITDSGTSLSVQTGDGAEFPDPSTDQYNCVIWDISTYANPADDPNVEIVRVTAKSTDTFTITRGQESTSGVAHDAGEAFALLLTSKMIDDIETNLDLKLENVVEDTTPQLGGDLDLNGNNIDFPTTANISDVLDEDNMASDSATALATQQSIKAYVDSNSIGDTEQSKAITVESPTASEDISMFETGKAITITEIRAVLRGSSTPSVTWTIRHASDRSAAGNEVVTSGTTTTSTTTGSDVTAFNDATIPADSFIWLETTAQSGDVSEINITIKYTID